MTTAAAILAVATLAHPGVKDAKPEERDVQIGTILEGWATHYGVPVEIAIAVAFHESTFRPWAWSRDGVEMKEAWSQPEAMLRLENTRARLRRTKKHTVSIGLMGILVGGSADEPGADLFDAFTNARLGVAHLDATFKLCKSWPAAVGVYNGTKKCGAAARSDYAKAVVATARKIGLTTK